MDKNKIIEAAAKLVAKGAYDKAIKEYQKILDVDPKDSRVLQKMGELYQKKGDNPQAAHFFTKVAESYSADGFFLKAVALYKQVLKLNPNLLDVNLKLAELHQQLGLMSEAMAYFQLVANHYDKAGDTKASLDTLKRMVDLDPENVASKIKLAELYARENMAREATQEFKRAAEYLKRNNRTDDYLRVAERLSTLEPDNAVLSKELAQLYLQKGDQKRALARLQVCFKADGRDVETLNMLAQAFQGLGQTSKTVSVYKELAKVYQDKGRTQDANGVWDKIAALDPQDPDLLARQAAAQPAPPPPQPQPQQPAQPQQPPQPQQTRPAQPQQPQQPQPPPQQPVAPPPPAAPAGMGKEQLTKLLTETDVYVKYGLHDKALDHLRKIFAVDPENLDAHEKAYNIYVASNNTAAASEQLLNVLRLCTRAAAVQRAQPYLAAILQENPGHPEVPAFLSVLRTSQTGMAMQAQVAETESLGDDAILVDSNEDEVIVAPAPEDALAQPEHDELALAAVTTGSDEDVIAEEPEAGTDESVIGDEAVVGEAIVSGEADEYGAPAPEDVASATADFDEVVTDDGMGLGDEPGLVSSGDDEPLVTAPAGDDETSFADVAAADSSDAYVVDDPALAAAADDDEATVVGDVASLEGMALGDEEDEAPTRVLAPPSQLLQKAAPAPTPVAPQRPMPVASQRPAPTPFAQPAGPALGDEEHEAPTRVAMRPMAQPAAHAEPEVDAFAAFDDEDEPTLVGNLPLPAEALPSESEPEVQAFAEPEAEPEVVQAYAEPQSEELVDPFAEPEAQVYAEPQSEELVDPFAEPEAEPQPEAQAYAEPEAQAYAEPEPEVQTFAEPEPEPQPEPEPVEAAAPESQPEPEAPAAEEEEPASEECDEASFFMDQGLFEEAREILETVLIAFGGHKRATELMARLEQLEAGGAPAAEESEPAAPVVVPSVQPVLAQPEPERDAFDLAAELAGEIDNLGGEEASAPASEDDFQYSVEEVFAEFKKGLEKVVKPEDVDTHYDLGIAYKEMGLLDDAVGEFTVARQGCMGTKREVDCLTMVGLLQGMKGDHAAAVATFKEGLATEHATGEVGKALRFELATAYEALGEGGKALFHFQHVASLDPKYRDVSSHAGRLAASVAPEEDSISKPTPPKPSASAAAAPPPPAAAAGAPKARKVGYV